MCNSGCSLCNHASSQHENITTDKDHNVLSMIKDLINLQQNNEEIELRMTNLNQEIGVWKDLKHFVENLQFDEIPHSEKEYQNQYNEDIDIFKDNTQMQKENTQMKVPTSIVKREPAKKNFMSTKKKALDLSVMLGAQMKFLFIINHPGVKLIYEEMKRNYCLKSFESALGNVMHRSFILDSNEYQYMLRFSLTMLKAFVKKGRKSPRNSSDAKYNFMACGRNAKINPNFFSCSASKISSIYTRSNKAFKKEPLDSGHYRCVLCKMWFYVKSVMIRHYLIKHKINLANLPFESVEVAVVKLDTKFQNAIEYQQKNDLVPVKCKICQYVAGHFHEAQKTSNLQQMIGYSIKTENTLEFN